MILEKQTETLILEEGEIKSSSNMEIDADSHIFLMRMLSKFYSDGIGSLIRETASNALDSHRQAKSTNPIIVKFEKNAGGNYEFSVEDFGLGIDLDCVENVIKKYGKSTKRESKDQLGAFGLGFKSPLAYKSSFCFRGRKDGMERMWMMYESDDEQNKIDLLHEKPTKEKNGVKIIVSVDYYDRNNFITKIKEQLAYFENVYFNVNDGYHSIPNDFVIYRGKDFQYSELSTDRNMHLCLDNVYYPIDYDKLGIEAIRIPIGLKFSLTDGIFPIPNRESIKYTKEAKEIILKKISKVSDFFIEKYNKTLKEETDVFTVYNHYNYSLREVDIVNQGANGTRISHDVSCLEKYASIKIANPTLKGVNKFPLERLTYLNDYLLGEYAKHYKLSNGRLSEIKYRESVSIRDTSSSTFYIAHEKITALKKDYVKSVSGSSNVYFLRKSKSFKLGKRSSDYSTYYKMIELHKFPRSEWRELIKEYQHIISLIVDRFVDLDKLVIPQDFIDARKKKKEEIIVERRKKLEGEITGKECKPLERYVHGKNSKLVPEIYDLSTMHQNKYISVYGKIDDAPLMDKLFSVFNINKVRFIVFSEREIKNLEEIKLHNWIEIKEFMKGESKSFKRIVTAYLIRNLMQQNQYVFSRKETLNEISTDMFDKISTLSSYSNNWWIGGDEGIYKAMLEVANANNLFDETIYHLYKEMKYILEKLKFLNPLLGTMSGYKRKNDEEIVDAICDLFKYYKHKLNTDKYKIVINDSPVEELSEEKVEELVNGI